MKEELAIFLTGLCTLLIGLLLLSLIIYAFYTWTKVVVCVLGVIVLVGSSIGIGDDIYRRRERK